VSDSLRESNRCAVLRRIADRFVSDPIVRDRLKVDDAALVRAVNNYWHDHPAMLRTIKSAKIDRHKVGAAMTLYVYREKPIQSRLPMSSAPSKDSYISLANELFAFVAGFTRIAEPSLVPAENKAAIFSLLRHNQATWLALSLEYFNLENMILSKQGRLSLPVGNPAQLPINQTNPSITGTTNIDE